jgi:hypothetical protein
MSRRTFIPDCEKKEKLLAGIEDELLAWLLEIIKNGESFSTQMIAAMASNLSPSFREKSYRSKYDCIHGHFLLAHHCAIMAAREQAKQQQHANSNQPNNFLAGIEDELLAWLLERIKNRESFSTQMIAAKASDLSPSFREKSYRSKYDCIRRRFLVAHHCAIMEATEQEAKQQHANSNQPNNFLAGIEDQPNNFLAGIEGELVLAWLLERIKNGESFSTQIAAKASDLSPSFREKSYRSKYDCIRRRFLVAHHCAIMKATEQAKQRHANNNQHSCSKKVFYAKQFVIDDEKAPVLPPDFIEGHLFTVRSVEKARQQYNLIRLENQRKHNQYARRALYKKLFEGHFMLLDHDVHGDFDISIEYGAATSLKCNHSREQISHTTWVKVRSAHARPDYLCSLLEVDTQLDVNKGCVRQGRGDVGTMWQVGVKNRGFLTHRRKLYKATQSIRSPSLSSMNNSMSDFFKRAFPKEFMEIQQGNKGMDIDKCISGDGSLFTYSISRDLGNASHLDSGDASIGISTWVEEKPGMATNWYFILPNTTLLDNQSKAVVIKLSHGLSISWDGRIVHHCTSVTDTGEENHVYGNFTSTCRARTLG